VYTTTWENNTVCCALLSREVHAWSSVELHEEAAVSVYVYDTSDLFYQKQWSRTYRPA